MSSQGAVRTAVADAREVAQHLRGFLVRVVADAKRPVHRVTPERSLFG